MGDDLTQYEDQHGPHDGETTCYEPMPLPGSVLYSPEEARRYATDV